jgi:FkbM family methyltransferase
MMKARRLSVGAASFVVVDDKATFWDRFAQGRWEPETLAVIAKTVGAGITLVDIGAWVGPITLAAAALGARVLAFEPDPRAFELLDANIAANPELASRIAIWQRAVAPRAGRLRFGSPRKPGDSMGSVLLSASAAAIWEAEAVTPQDVAKLVDGRERIVLKIDIEGGEYGLLPAIAPLLTRATRAALVAFHPRLLTANGQRPEAVARLTDGARAAFAGFSCRRLDGSGPMDAVSTAANSTVLFERPLRPRAARASSR